MSLDKIFSNEIDRRDFLRKSTDVGLGLTGLLYGVDRFANLFENSLEGKLSLSPQEAEAMGCAPGLLYFKEEPPVIYPPLKGQKVQPPKEGCLIGFYPGWFEVYQREIGAGPKVIIPYFLAMYNIFPTSEVEEVSSQGAIPFVYRPLANEARVPGLKNLVNDKTFTTEMIQYAKDAVEYGKPFFICTMRELNGNWYPWGQQSKTAKKAWRHMWQIFEEKGANEYATWVIEYHVDFPLHGYWPGDEYVDWIGLSAYNRAIHRQYYGYRYLSNLINHPYRYFRTNYPDKPIRVEEFGTTIGKDQPRWLRKAFETIKSTPGLKAAIYFDNVYNITFYDDHTLSRESMKTLKELLKDPYFIGAK